MANVPGGIIEVVSPVGDTVVEGTLLLRVHGGRVKISELDLRKTAEMGTGRTFEQDPKYAIRSFVEVAIKAVAGD
jgi:uncharacterized membrane protein